MFSKTELVARFDCDSAEEFFERINPLSSCYKDVTDPIFRGISSEEYKLIPSALRPDAENFLNSFATNMLDPVWYGSDAEYMPIPLIREFKLVKKFYWRLVRNGLKVPEDRPELRELFGKSFPGDRPKILKTCFSEGEWWPPASIDSLLALAQHHGLSNEAARLESKSLHSNVFCCKGWAGKHRRK